jgi:hypothetical protein
VIKKIFGFYRLPLYIITHPVDGFYAMKFEQKGTVKVALFNFLLTCIAFALNNQYTSLIVNPRHPLALNSFRDFYMLFGALILFCVSNWSVTSLTNGEGRFKDIIMAVCYSMTPLILTLIPATIISNFLSYEETGFYHMILSIGLGYFVLLVFLGLLTVHNYTVVKALITVFLTFVALLVIVFLITLLFTLWQQLVTFVYSLRTEILFRA